MVQHRPRLPALQRSLRCPWCSRLQHTLTSIHRLGLISAQCVQETQTQETQVDMQAHAEQVSQLQAAHEEEIRRVQQAAQQAQADMQAAHAAETGIIKEAHAADLNRLRALQDALPERLMQLQAAEPRQSTELSPSEIGACRCTLVCMCSRLETPVGCGSNLHVLYCDMVQHGGCLQSEVHPAVCSKSVD